VYADRVGSRGLWESPVDTTARNGKSLMPSPVEKQSEAKMPIKTSRAEYDNVFGFDRDIAKLNVNTGC